MPNGLRTSRVPSPLFFAAAFRGSLWSEFPALSSVFNCQLNCTLVGTGRWRGHVAQRKRNGGLRACLRSALSTAFRERDKRQKGTLTLWHGTASFSAGIAENCVLLQQQQQQTFSICHFSPIFFVEILFFSILLDSLVFRADPSRLGGIRAIVISVRPRLLGSEDLRRSCLCLGIISQNSSFIYIYISIKSWVGRLPVKHNWIWFRFARDFCGALVWFSLF